MTHRTELVAFVFADRDPAPLDPIARRTCVALLPVAGKPLLQHTLEDLAEAGVRRVVLFVGAGAGQVEARFGDGTRLGLELEYVLSRGQESPEDLLWRWGDLPSQFLALRGDVLRSASVSAFLRGAAAAGAEQAQGYMAGTPCAMVLGNDRRAVDSLDGSQPSRAALPAGCRIAIAGGAFCAIDSLQSYYLANLKVVAGLFEGLSPPGRPLAAGLRVGRGSDVETRVLVSGAACLGERCRVHPGATLAGPVVVGDGCLVDRGATLSKTVVMPDTYVGAGVDVRHAIVDRDRIIRIDHGVAHRVTDDFLLAGMSASAPGALARAAQCLLGLAALLVSLPLWPLAAVLSVVRAPRRPLVGVRLLGNKHQLDALGEIENVAFTGWQWQTRVAILRRLPLLLAVVSGHLRLIGVRPRPVGPADELVVGGASGPDWPAGLIGPVQVLLPATAPREEALLGEIHYARARRWWTDCQLLAASIGALFTRRPWRLV
jgi:NDP-sugar pyrophosphorylase family protein